MSEIRSPISVVDPVNAAMRRTGQLLFKPFNFRRWVAITFALWLSALGEGGGGFNFNIPTGGGGGPGGSGGSSDVFGDALRWMNDHLVLVIGLVVVGTLLLFAIYMVQRWLSSRGHFMVLDALTRSVYTVGTSWRANAEPAYSFFKFRLVADFVVFNAIFVPVVIGGLLALIDLYNVWPNLETYRPGVMTFVGIGVAVVGALVMALLFLVPYGLLQMFVPVIMRSHGINAWPAAKLFLKTLLRPNLGSFVLFVLVNIVIGFVVGAASLVVTLVLMLVTCCIFWVIMALPLVGNVALYAIFLGILPVLVFARCYALYFLAQFDPRYNLFEDDAAPVSGFMVVVDHAGQTPAQ